MTNFWDALSSVDQTQPVPQRVEYRLYYNDESGEVLFYSTEAVDGTFIYIDKTTYHRHRFDVRIKNGKIVPLKPGLGKLVPSTSGAETASNDVSLIEPGSNTFWKSKTYERD